MKAMNTLKVYKYDYDGDYQESFSIEGSVENLASFIAGADLDSKYTITDTWDQLVATTIGNYLDYCPNKDLLVELQPLLVRKQMSGKSEFDVEYTDDF